MVIDVVEVRVRTGRAESMGFVVVHPVRLEEGPFLG
jgi:hypothetical protein